MSVQVVRHTTRTFVCDNCGKQVERTEDDSYERGYRAGYPDDWAILSSAARPDAQDACSEACFLVLAKQEHQLQTLAEGVTAA